MKKLLVIIMACSMLFSACGVFATWQFAEDVPDAVNKAQGVYLSEFVWAPEEILPDVTPGQNYLDLHQSILENVKGGLNSSKDTLENAVLRDSDGLLHSSQNVQGGNLSHLFITEACRELDFIAQYVTNSEFLVYMYKSSDTLNGAVGTSRMQVYKTIYIKTNGEWSGQETQLGTAIIQFFPNTNTLAIDVNTWTR